MIESPPTRIASGKLETLEVVRALAALAVVAYHATDLPFRRGYAESLHEFFSYGKYGVHVFFALSGFIIFYIHGKDLGKPEKASNYFWRRWVRIWPLYAVITFLQVLGKPLLLGGPADSPTAIVTSLFFLDLENPTIVTVGWTLVHEAFFYVIFGALIVLGRQFSLIFLAIFILCQFVVQLDPSSLNPLVAFVFSPLRWYFLAGIAAACWVASSQHPNEKGLRKTSILIGAVMLLMSLILALQGGSMSSLLAPSLGVALVVLVLWDLRISITMPRILVFLGAASYSIYLVHANVLDIGLKLISKIKPSLIQSSLGLIMVALAILAVIGGVVCHLLIERPLLSWLRERGKKSL